jgi:hypothetical protein
MIAAYYSAFDRYMAKVSEKERADAEFDAFHQ